jgi:hypothetical protein
VHIQNVVLSVKHDWLIINACILLLVLLLFYQNLHSVIEEITVVSDGTQLSFFFFLSLPPEQAALHRIAVGHNITADYWVYITQF